MVETSSSSGELERLVVSHAQIVSRCGPDIEMLAGRQDLIDAAQVIVENKLRGFARGMNPADKSALFSRVAAVHPGLPLEDTRRLFGL